MIVILIVPIGPQAVLFVVMGIARHPLIGMDGIGLSANAFALLLTRRGQRGVGIARMHDGGRLRGNPRRLNER